MRYKTFGNFVAFRRKQLGITQGEFSRIFGLKSAQFISNWERNLSHPPLSYLEGIATTLQVDLRVVIDEYLKSKANVEFMRVWSAYPEAFSLKNIKKK